MMEHKPLQFNCHSKQPGQRGREYGALLGRSSYSMEKNEERECPVFILRLVWATFSVTMDPSQLYYVVNGDIRPC